MTRTALIAAMHEELAALLPALQGATVGHCGGREFWLGALEGQPVVAVLSGIGKVAASITATLLIDHYQVERALFIGVAGGLGEGVQVGDVVVANALLQHDMDASPLFPRFEVPLTGRSRFDAHVGLADALAAAAQRCLDRAAALIGSTHLLAFDIAAPLVHRGLVVSGDRFVASAAASEELRQALPDALAVEMEGAAVAQACADFRRPFAVLRTISDRADDSAHVDFTRFIDEVASVYTRAIVEDWLQHRGRA